MKTSKRLLQDQYGLSRRLAVKLQADSGREYDSEDALAKAVAKIQSDDANLQGERRRQAKKLRDERFMRPKSHRRAR